MRISILLLPLLFTVATLAEPEAAPVVASSSRSSSKSNEKTIFPKKATSLKKRPTKSSAITENLTATAAAKIKKPLSATVFKNLTADDLDFIKELDHQFSVHGEKIKIKVERTNSTGTKNPKRTIDGELGYGYTHNGYEYERPKFMFYPYSQKDISSDSPGYYPKEEHTSVTIEPSYSYELKPQTYEAPHQPQIDLPTPGVPQYSAHGSGADDSHQPQQQYYQEPVIVLRIPGPAKYASHLQSLLQQYLEIRAAQYLRILENSELEQHQQPEQHVDYQPQQEHAAAPQQYEQPPQTVEYQSHQAQEHPDTHQQYEQQPQHESHAEYQQQLAYAHQIAETPQPVSYPNIDDVYHSYKERHQQQQQHQQAEAYAAPAQQPQQEQYYHQPETAYHAPAAPQPTADVVPQYYYMHDQHYADSPHGADGGSNAQSYQHVYVIAMSSPHASSQQLYAAPESTHAEQHQHQHQMQQPIYVQDEHQAHANDQEQHFSITENSPRETHTKVFFSTHSSEQNSHDYSMHMLPSIRPHDRYAPASTPTYQYKLHAEESAPSAAAAVSGVDQHSVEYQQTLVAPAEPQHEVAITQRPHNYHAHPHKPKGRTRISTKRAVTPVNDGTDKHLEDIHAYVASKLGAKMGAQQTYKTTKIING